MKYNLIFTSKFDSDFEIIIDKFNSRTIILNIFEEIENLIIYPKIAIKLDKFGLRKLIVCKNFIVLYQINGLNIELLSIFHHKQNNLNEFR